MSILSSKGIVVFKKYGFCCEMHLIYMIRKKVYYVPGLISLIGVPVLFAIFLPKIPPKEYALKVYLPSNSKLPKSNSLVPFTRDYVLKSIRKQKIITVSIDKMIADSTQEIFNSKMQFIEARMRQIGFSDDTTIVLKVVFGKSNTLGDFVRLYDMASQCKVYQWMLDGNEAYFIPRIHDPQLKEIDVPLTSM